MKRFIRQYAFFIIILLALCSLLALNLVMNAPPLSAHPDGPEHGHIHPSIEEVKKAHQRDAQPPDTSLESLTGAVTPCSGGFAGPYPCNNVDLLAFMPLADIGGVYSNSAANDIWGWTDPQTGKEYALVGRKFGTSFVDISDPINPVYLGELSTHGAFGSTWRDIKVYNDHTFIVSEANQHGMQVFDLTQLRNVAEPPVTFDETAHYNGNTSAHNIVINEASGFAYIVGAGGASGCSGGLHMVNIQNPTSPTFAGCFSNDGYTHDAQCVNYSGPDPDYQGAEICINSNEDTITVVDVTNKSAPSQVARIGYTGANYTHQGWLTEDQAYFVLDDELDEINDLHNTYTYVWDVRDLDNPLHIGTYISNTPNIDHNQYVKGNFSYQADYRAGLHILDISDVANGNLSEVAYFDIYPADDNPNFNGAWSNYPYFASGVVIVSGIEQGLYILQPNLSPEPTPTGTPTNTPVPPTPTPTNTPTDIPTPTNTPTPTETPTPTNTPIPPTATPAPVTMHAGDIDGTALNSGKDWQAQVSVTVHTENENPVSGATVSGVWSGDTAGSGDCITDGSGSCTITSDLIPKKGTSSAIFTIAGISHATLSYNATANHDPDGDSSGTAIQVNKDGSTSNPGAPTPTPTPTATPDPSAPSSHVGDLDGSASPSNGGKWDATITITLHDGNEALLADATVSGSWSAGASGSGSCVTDGSGQCNITGTNINKNSASATFTVDSVTHATNIYNGVNHDSDGDSNGTVITVSKP